MPRINQIQVRRDTAANWTSTNPVLAAGEMGLETDTRKTKFGDGTTSWTSLAYATSAGLISSDTAPDSPSVGAQWFNSSTGKTYVYYDGYWVELDSNGTSATSTGNAIINGAFEINQRGFSSSTAGGYGFDRWLYNASGGTGTYSSQSFTPGAAPVNGYEAANFARLAVTTGNDFCGLVQRIEDVRTFANQTVTVSFFAKGTNPTTEGGLYVVLTQLFGSGGSSFVNTISSKFTLTADWQRFTFTLAVPSISGKTIGAGSSLDVAINQGASISTDSYTLDIWGVQVEAGSTATPFRRNANSIQGELAACQRYYIRWGHGTQAFPLVAPSGIVAQTTEASGFINLPSRMRTVSSVEFSNLRIQDVNLNNFSVTGVSLATSNFGGNTITVNFISSGMTTGRFCRVLGDDNTSAFLAISGEL